LDRLDDVLLDVKRRFMFRGPGPSIRRGEGGKKKQQKKKKIAARKNKKQETFL